MHLLKSMGGAGFGAKPAGTNAKSSYFSSLKLEYQLVYTRDEKDKPKNGK